MYADAAPFSRTVSIYLPLASRAIPIPDVNREDALLVAILRDVNVYFGTDKVRSEDLSSQILERLKDRSVERKIYIKADARARFGMVKDVLDAIHSTGIEKIAFLTDDGNRWH
ncbi:MAG: outer rane transport energization protein ExbD [Acidobacteriaceae bacterium]|jgi:biopolymer transport protein TolR|nr:outer rane transport energization protein ExbD [Acidobacteriaceae bacterium]